MKHQVESVQVREPADRWTIQDAAELYELNRWGHGYFSIGANGHLLVHPSKNPQQAVDLKALVDRLASIGVSTPVLIRFAGILQQQIREIHAAFEYALEDLQYQGEYRCVYPIKVNQQAHVVREVMEFGRRYGMGLEAGSKPELLAVLGLSDEETLVICNGFKDEEFLEMCVLAQKMGRQVIPVIEKYSELEWLLKLAEKWGVRPALGVRVKLATRGAGRWRASGGYRSKFGLTITEVLRLLAELKRRGLEDCFQLLHFHLGSQITNIRVIKVAVTEAARIYAELYRLGAGLKYLDVGGGLAVDYDGSQTDFSSSMNYTLQEYANDIVFHIQNVCKDTGTPNPGIITECGRAIVAHHSVLVFDVLGAAVQDGERLPDELPLEARQPLIDLKETYERLSLKNLMESLHDAQQAIEEALHLFNLGFLSIEQRGWAERYYWAICRRIHQLATQLEERPEELEKLESLLADTYFCNFSIFQSIPDSWAIRHLFPVMPIHRLNEQPTRFGILGDISCDSDGKLDHFIGRKDVRRTLPLHALNGEPYYLGVFLVGAYQEILGDMHNLFGDTNAVHVALSEDGQVEIQEVVRGDSVREVLRYVEFRPELLLEKFCSDVKQARRRGLLNEEEAKRLVEFYRDGLEGYTYLET